jgi:hypothetical protein
MKGFEDSSTLVAYMVSNAVAVILLLVAWKKPRIARVMFVLLFGWAASTNWSTVIQHPDVYLEYADLTFWDVYQKFILGWFRQHIVLVVGTIATCQALIAIAMLLKGWLLDVGIFAAIIFLLAIAPLGVGSAFPFSIIASIALYKVYRSPFNDYLFRSTLPTT